MLGIGKIVARLARHAPGCPADADRVPLRARAGGGRLTPASYEARHEAYPPGGLATLKRMQRDPQVRACVATKKLCVLAEEVEVRPAGADRLSRRAAQTVEAALAALPGGVCCLIEGALDALPMGYAVGELVWAPGGSLDRVAWHDPARFQFVGGPCGDVERLEVLGHGGLTLPRSRFVLWSYQARYGNPYGESDLVAAYRPWALKDALLRFWAAALDRFGAPTVVGKVPPHTPQEQRDELLSLLSALQTRSSLVVGNDTDVSTLESGRAEPGAGFEAAANFCNREIAKAVLGQTLTTEPGDSGSYGLGKVHHDVFGKWVAALRREVGIAVLTEQIARPLTTLLLGPDHPAPTVALPGLTGDEMAARRDLVLRLIDGNVVAPDEAWIRSYLGVPDPAGTIL